MRNEPNVDPTCADVFKIARTNMHVLFLFVSLSYGNIMEYHGTPITPMISVHGLVTLLSCAGNRQRT